MVRTKATVNTSVRVSAAKAPRKYTAPSCSSIDSSSSGGKRDKTVGGNPICPRPTPDWQKPIGTFFSAVMPDKSEVKNSTEDTDHKNKNVPDQRTEDKSVPDEHAATPLDEDKENINPEQDVEIPDDQPGPSSSSSSNPISKPSRKKRKILKMFESDSEEEQLDPVPNTSGCIVAMEDEITTC